MKSRYLTTVLVASLAITPSAASAQVSIGISVRLAPPPLPVYVQPPLPGPDYLWTPGYWAWDDIAAAYYWVPGTWVRAPRPGLLWTPPWWGWSDGIYVFHTGYWGSHVGFYGGIIYGFGYTGLGYQGGYWNGGRLFYNQTVNNITDVNITNIYRRDVTVNRINRVSYNNGPGGIQAQPTLGEKQATREQHIAATDHQLQQAQAARMNPRSFAAANRGNPQQGGYGSPDRMMDDAGGQSASLADRHSIEPDDLQARANVAQLSHNHGLQSQNIAEFPDNVGNRAHSKATPMRADARSDQPQPAEPDRYGYADGRPATPLPHGAAHHNPSPRPKPAHGPTPSQKHTPRQHHDDHHHG